MGTIHGYYDGTTYIALEPADVQVNQKVVITILDEFIPQSAASSLSALKELRGKGGRLCAEDPAEYVGRLRSNDRS